MSARPERDYEKLHHGEKLTALADAEQTLAETLHQHGHATANLRRVHGLPIEEERGLEKSAGKQRSWEYPEDLFNE